MSESTDALATEKVGTLLLRYSLPAIIGTAATSLYSIIDRVFIGQGIGAFAISGLALTLPLMNLSAAFGALIGIGASVLVTIRLGRADAQGASALLGHTFTLNVISGLLYSAVLLVFLDPVLRLFGASDETLPYAKEFMEVSLAGNVFLHLYMGLNHVLRASGHPKAAMNITLLTIGINAVLAPLFIFALHWGIRGAAGATVCAQVAGTVAVLRSIQNKQSAVRFSRSCFALRWKVVKRIIAVGSSTFLMLICASLVSLLFNLGLEQYGGDLAVGAFGIINSIMMLFVMIALGVNQGMQPIVGYNYGARNFARVTEVFRAAIGIASGITVFGFILMEAIPEVLARMFTSDSGLIDLACGGMRIFAAMSFLIGSQMIITGLFQALGKARISILLALSRQELVLIPLLFIMPRFWGLNGVWVCSPLSDLISSILAFSVLRAKFPALKAQSLEVTP